MTVVKFLQDFQGVETNGAFYERDQVVDVPSGVASRCVADKRAELVEQPKVVEIETEETNGTPITSALIVSTEPEKLPDVIIDEPAPIMTSTNQTTTRNRHGKK